MSCDLVQATTFTFSPKRHNWWLTYGAEHFGFNVQKQGLKMGLKKKLGF